MGMAEIKAVIDADTHWIGWDDIREVLGNAKAGRRSKYEFGDFDPSGVDIPKKVERDLREFSGDADITFEVVAVKPWQIDAYGLQTRPTKTTDSRAKNFGSESVEVDAIHPDQLRTIARNCIEQLIDAKILEGTRLVESAERDSLKEFIAGWGCAYGQ